MFPFVTVVDCPQAQMLEKIGPTLVCSAITCDPAFRRSLVDAVHIDRLNLGPVPTIQLNWLQPHEGQHRRVPVPRAGVPDRGPVDDAEHAEVAEAQTAEHTPIAFETEPLRTQRSLRRRHENPLGDRRRRLDVLRQLPARQRARRAADRARARRDADPALHAAAVPTKPNVTRPEVLFGGISIYLQHHSALVSPAAALRRSAARCAVADQGVRRSIGVDRPEAPGRPDDLDARRPRRRAAQGIRQAARVGEAASRGPTSSTITNSMLIGLARPLADALKAPICCTLQGEELFLEGLTEPYRTRALELIRDAGAATSIASSRSANSRRAYMRDTWQIPAERMAVVPLGIDIRTSRTQRSRAPSAERRARQAFTIGFLGRIAPEKGLHLLADAFVRLRRKTGRAQMRLEAAGYLAAAHKPYLADVQRILERAGLQGDFVYHGAVDRAGKVAFPARHRRHVDAGDLRRAERFYAARSDGERGAGRRTAARCARRDRGADRWRTARRS